MLREAEGAALHHTVVSFPTHSYIIKKIWNVIWLYAIQNHTICCLISRTVIPIYHKSKRGVLNAYKYIIKQWLIVIIFQINDPALWESEEVPYFIHNGQMRQKPLKSWSGKLLPIPTRTDKNILVNKKNLLKKNNSSKPRNMDFFFLNHKHVFILTR